MKKLFFLLVFCLFLFNVHAQAPNHPITEKSDPRLPSYLIDGVETPYSKVVKINSSLIESMYVFKGPEAMAKYGAKYKHGLVLINLKKGKK